MHKIMILRGIVVCWIRISQEASINPELQDVQTRLRQLIVLLQKVTESEGGLKDCAVALVEKNEACRELFHDIH